MQGDRAGSQWRGAYHHGSPYPSAGQQRGGAGGRQVSPPSPYEGGASSPHRYEVGPLRGYGCNPGDSLPRSSSQQNSAPGISGSRGSTYSRGPHQGQTPPNDHAAGGYEFNTPYNTRRSPTQLRYFEEVRNDRPSPGAGGVQFTPPPPFPRVGATTHYAQGRGLNVFDQDQHAEISPMHRANHMHQRGGGGGSYNPNYGAGRSSSAALLPPSHTAAPTSRAAVGGRPQFTTQYQQPASLPRAASSGHFSHKPTPRIHFFDNCNAIVEEREGSGASGHIKTSFRCGSLLGTGGFAKVFDFTDCRTGDRFACKVIDKSKLSEPSKRAKLAAEIDVHRRMSHPNILRFIRSFDDDYYHYILLERCCRQSLMELSRSRGTFTLEETQFILLQLIQGVESLHSNRVIHRDLKLGNVMVDIEGNMKIGDFGFATELRSDSERKRTMCGTPNYIAPEILTADRDNIGYSYEADVWSLGVILYTLTVGVPPFETASLQTTYSRIKRCEYTFPPTVRVPDACRELIGWMLQRDPRMRPHLMQIRAHHFLRFPEAPRTAPQSLIGLDPDLVPPREAGSPYAEAGRVSSPIQDSQVELGSPVQSRPSESAVPPFDEQPPGVRAAARDDYAGAEGVVEFTPPPAYHPRGPQPTPYHFHETPSRQRTSAGQATTTIASPFVVRPLYTDPATIAETVAPAPASSQPLSATRMPSSAALPAGKPLVTSPQRTTERETLRNRISSFLKEETRTAADAAAQARMTFANDPLPASSSTSTTSSPATTGDDHFDTSNEDSTDCLEREEVGTTQLGGPASNGSNKAPPAPRVFFTDIVHFPRYGYGFQTWDQRGSLGGHRVKATGAYLNDKSKLVRDIKDDTVWYFARVRDDVAIDGAATGHVPGALTDDAAHAPRCFYDQLHQYMGGAQVLDPKSGAYEAPSTFLQTQHVFKKYTIVKFIETHLNTHWHPNQTSSSTEALHHVASALKEFFLEPHQDIYAPEPLSNSGDAASEITFIKEATILPVTALLPPSHAMAVELLHASAHRVPLMAVARFSDLSFQVSLSAPCPSSLQITPQVVGVKGVSAISQWKLDVILYDTNRLSVVYRADDDAYALSMSDVGLQKRRGFGGSVVFTASASFPKPLTAILIPETTVMLIVAMLRRVHCPEELLSLITIAA